MSVVTKSYVVNVLITCAVVFQLQHAHKKGNGCPLKCSSEGVVTAGHTERGRTLEPAYLNTNTNTSKWDELPLCLSCYGSSLQRLRSSDLESLSNYSNKPKEKKKKEKAASGVEKEAWNQLCLFWFKSGFVHCRDKCRANQQCKRKKEKKRKEDEAKTMQ